MVDLYVESALSAKLASLPADLIDELKRSTTYRDPLYAQRRRQGLSVAGLTPSIKTHREQDGRLILWRGALGKVIRALKSRGVEFSIHDQRLWLPRIKVESSIELRPYQRHPVDVMVRRQQTVGRGPAGSGKTEMLLAAAAHFGQPTLVLVWQERQQRVWLDRVPRCLGQEAGGIGGAFHRPSIKPITIGMVQSVRPRIDELRYLFGCVICDEVDRFAAPTLREVVNAMPAAVRLGASDDERRRDGREFLLYDTFGPRGWDLGKATGQCAVDIVAVPTSLRYPGSAPDDWSALIEDMLSDEKRHELVLSLVESEVRGGHRVLVWSDRVEYCQRTVEDLRRRGVAAGLLIGGREHKDECDATEKGLVAGTIQVGVGTSVAEKSINIPPLDRGVMTCASADRKLFRFRQMRGRLARPFIGKDSRLFYLWDRWVPILYRRLWNIKRRYHVRRVRQTEETMPEKVAVTLETLKLGCKSLGIGIPKGADLKKLEVLIKRELTKNKTYGSYCCGACFRDIVDRLTICPYCASKFKPARDEPEEVEEEEAEAEEQPAEDEELVAEDEVEEEAEEVEEEAEEVEEEEAGEEEVEEEEAEEGEEEEEAEEEAEEGEEEEAEEEVEEEEGEEEEGEEEEHEFDQVEEEEVEEEEEAPRPKKTTKPKVKVDQKEREATEKRAQIRSELPYTEKQLKAMKRTTIVMVASILGIKDPVRLGSTEKLIATVRAAQAKAYPVKPQTKTAAKVPAKVPAKPASKPKVVSKPKR